MKKRSGILARVSSAILAGALVAGPALTAPAMAQDKPWRHGVIEPKSDAGFLLMAFTRDFAKKQGIDLQYVALKNDTLGLRSIISGDLESYEGGPPVTIWARGTDVKIIGCPWIALPHGVYARIGITSVKDLEGKTMATSAPSSMPDLLGRLAVGQAGLAPGSVKLANVGGDADRYRSLAGSVVDAAVISSEYTPIMDPTTMHLLRSGVEIAPDYVRTCIGASAKTLAQRPDDAARFLAAEMSALRFALANRAETIRLSQESTGQKSDDSRAAFVFDEVIRTGSVDATLPIPVEKLASMQQSMLKLGVVAKLVDVQSVVDTAPRAKALTLLGR